MVHHHHHSRSLSATIFKFIVILGFASFFIISAILYFKFDNCIQKQSFDGKEIFITSGCEMSVQQMRPKIKPFSIENLGNLYKKSLILNDDIDLLYYNEGFVELAKLLEYMGKMFYFINSEVEDKLFIIQRLRENYHGPQPNPYNTIKSMINYEKSQKLLGSDPAKNGARNVLRLHRALLFLIEFIDQLSDQNSQEDMQTIASATYGSTLSKFHGWAIRKAVAMATYALPDKKDFFLSIVHSQKSPLCSNVQVCQASFRSRAIPSMRAVYRRMDEIYTQLDLHSLP